MFQTRLLTIYTFLNKPRYKNCSWWTKRWPRIIQSLVFLFNLISLCNYMISSAVCNQ